MIAKFPPRGWNSWDCFGASVNEAQVRENAEYIAKNMKDTGWEYVVVDIEWFQPTAATHEYEPFSNLVMDDYGRLYPAQNRFPSAADGAGFAPLAEYVHSLGLKFGIHIMRGMPRLAAHKNLPILDSQYMAAQIANPSDICCWNPDMYGLRCELDGAYDYYLSIFKLYASWGVDFVKVDDIAREYPKCKTEIEVISKAARNCGRDIVLSLSPGPAPIDRAQHLKENANMWRITDDFWDKWELLLDMFDRAESWCTHSGPGHWPDADMLPVGALRQCYDANEWTRFTKDEQITMMTLWCMMRSPLMVGAHLPKNDEFTLNLLTNKQVLDIQLYSHCAHQLYRTESDIVWIAPRKDGKGTYLALFNISEQEKKIDVDLEGCELDDVSEELELWSNEKNLIVNHILSAKIAAHGAAVYLLN